ncbi:MAG: ABC transporter substrate-binding protein [Candidatus Nitrosopumilus limneticus]|nr:ABC transporter substrate-binding protein [Candidatus Nitrosopumilus limneticus]MDC4214766.1 ABC transporter substrate-binding protein [Candidatus Nitrosopumilus limneticus]MDC4215628.1 ABC transporter substrate-binding protein [Candidatus Nitrosopumilus limneticus]MDC4216673.1 ABC transporter substrate-binding protein [Candidatus Nitrosopumilus limneticus]MDC4217705.1 ABC transporter substrate-binding protein [Candidatus Nitrosopumilus limneticus]
MITKLLLSVGIITVILASIVGLNLNSNEVPVENNLRIAYFANIGHAIPIVGIENGFFSDDIGSDIKIESRIFDSGPQAIESLFTNSVDIAYVGSGPAINGFLNSENNNVKILSGAASGGASFIVHPNSQINSASDFKGKKIATPQIGNTQDISLRHYLSENNLKPAEKGGSVIIYNISNSDIYTLFVKGDIDGAWVAEPWATVLEVELGGKRLFFEEDLWPNKQFASVLLIGNIDYVKKNPELISKFLVSHKNTADWINDNPIETRIIFNNFLKSHLGKSLSNDIVDISLSNLKITTDPVKDSVYSFAERANELGYLGRNGYDISEIFYTIDSNPNLEGGT